MVPNLDNSSTSNETKPSIVILGNSHVHMFRRSRDPNFSINWINFGSGASASHGNITLDEGLDLARDAELVAISLLGTFHNIFGLMKHDQPFDVMLPEDADIPVDVTLIPYRSILETFLGLMHENEPVRKIIEASGCPIVHLSPPPPKEEIVWKNPLHVLSEDVLNPATRRLRLWKAEIEAMRLFCQELNIELLPPPEGTQTREGFLEPYYANLDAVHANPKYGQLVLEQLSQVGLAKRAMS